MSTTKNTTLLDKIALARTYIKSKKLNKDGQNTYSNYNYYTPEYVDAVVTEACNEANIMCIFNLQSDANGYYGEIITYELESGENITTIMRTEKPTITATNATQQMGGMQTYTKRYMLMSLFNIEDNTIDFDAQDNRSKPTSKQPAAQASNNAQAPAPANDKPWLNKWEKDKVTLTPTWINVVNALGTKQYTLAQVQSKYKISKELHAELQTL